MILFLFLYSLFLCSFKTSYSFSDKYLSCSHVYDDVDEEVKFCIMVTWLSAQMYNPSNYSLYYPESPISLEDQDDYARSLYHNIRKNVSSNRPSCKNALKRLACAQVFPECPEAGLSMSGISYFPTCASQCQQAEALCNQELDCHHFPTFNCMNILPPGYFVLTPQEGPYDSLPGLYGAVLGVWIIITVYWHIASFILYKESSVIVCKAISTIPIVKVVVLILGTSFWSTCNQWKMCSFWLGVSLINTHLVFETGMMVCFLLIGKGWSITRDNFSANEWRGIIMSMSAFYMCDSIILVLDSSVLTKQGFWIANTILYGLMYIYILWNIQEQLYRISKQVELLGDDVPQLIAGPLKEKRRMYVCLEALIFISIGLEIFLHTLRQSSHMAQVLFVYELSNLLVLSTIGFIFRPREHSPFFLMIPATIEDDRTRPIPMIEGAYDEDCKVEVELQPLLNHRDGNGNVQENSAIHTTRLMFVRHPNHSVNVGISPSPSHILGDRSSTINQPTQVPINRHNSRNNNRVIVPATPTIITTNNNNNNNRGGGSGGGSGINGNGNGNGNSNPTSPVRRGDGNIANIGTRESEDEVEMGMLSNHP